MMARALLTVTILRTATTSGVAASDASSFAHGPAEVTVGSLFEWDGANARVSALGSIVADDGSVWSVPASTHFGDAATAQDRTPSNSPSPVSPAKPISSGAARWPAPPLGCWTGRGAIRSYWSR